MLVANCGAGDLFANNVALLDSVLVAEGIAVKAELEDVPANGKLVKVRAVYTSAHVCKSQDTSVSRHGMLARRLAEETPLHECMATFVDDFNKMLVDA